jgi:hypothetical protein
MSPFILDGKDINEFSDDDIVLTPAIMEFLKINEEDHKYFVVAPKGVGKTLFLMYKRNLYQKSDVGHYFIPRDNPIERGHSLVLITHEKLELLADHEKWIPIWKLCISLSIIKNIIKLYKPSGYEDMRASLEVLLNKQQQLPEEIRLLIRDQDTISIYGILNNILRLSYNNIIKIIDMSYLIEEIIKFVRFETITFIDNLDQRFEHYLRANDGNEGFDLKSVWFAAQIGLIKAIYELSASNGHIKVSASIRKEAFERMKTLTELSLQIIGETLDIQYTVKQLKRIFSKNIINLDEKDLVKPAYKQADPLYAFLGLKNNKIKSRGNQEEDIFDYIYRHTLKRPRDFMLIGQFLREIENVERNPDNIKRKVNEASYDIAETFLTEVKPFSDINDFNKVFGLIHSNVLQDMEIKEICRLYNNQTDCEKKNCKDCDNIHIFCDLYKLGLIGIIDYDDSSHKFKQKFIRIGDRSFESKILPYSEYYLTHPILNDFIKERNMMNRTIFEINNKIIIGDGYDWDDIKFSRSCTPIIEPEGIEQIPILELIAGGENNRIEFKSSLQWDLTENHINKALRYAVLKSIVAFLNSDGGRLIIGVKDNGEIIGLKDDLKVLGQSTDKYIQLLYNLIVEYIGPQYCRFIKASIETLGERQVCIVMVSKAHEAAFFSSTKNKEFYIRAGNTTRMLDPEQMMSYIDSDRNE